MNCFHTQRKNILLHFYMGFEGPVKSYDNVWYLLFWGTGCKECGTLVKMKICLYFSNKTPQKFHLRSVDAVSPKNSLGNRYMLLRYQSALKQNF